MCQIDLSPAERAIYDRIEVAGRKNFQRLLKKGQVVSFFCFVLVFLF